MIARSANLQKAEVLVVEMADPELPFDRVEPWTFEDLLELPESLWRYEIIDGGLHMTPPSGILHDMVCDSIRTVLERAMPAGYRVLGPVGVDIHPTYLVPDLVVIRVTDLHRDGPQVHPSDVVLVVEVVAPGSVSNDRILKPIHYADAAIPAYWRVETEPRTSLTAYTLTDDATVYTEVGDWIVGETAKLTEPFPITIPIANLEK